MIEAKVTIEPKFEKVEKAVEKESYNSFRHAGFSIAKAAKASIVKSRNPSKPGEPPTTRGRGRKNLKGAIFTASDRESAIVGPRHSYVGESGEVHEFGKPRGGERFPKRPFMAPALEKSLPRFASDWQGSIGE
jgi:phage gpG-like protein